ncbi:MAG TPA: hypothetical protein VKY31_03910 [Terriglobia bacterium]|nr:hypothetical protein [Terriglobia bacterium]
MIAHSAVIAEIKSGRTVEEATYLAAGIGIDYTLAGPAFPHDEVVVNYLFALRKRWKVADTKDRKASDQSYTQSQSFQ